VPKLSIFADMKMHIPKIHFHYVLLALVLTLFACRSEIKRFIDPEDTRYSEDVRAISRRINKDPNNADLYYKRSNTFFFEDKFSEALLDIEVAIALQPENAFYYFKQGEYYMSGDTANAQKAEKSYLKSIALNPNAEEPRLKYAILLLAKQRYEETAEQLNAILRTNTANADALFFMGMVNKESGDTIRAIQRFRETVEMNNTYYNAYMQLAMLHLDNNFELCLAYLDNALRIDEFSDEANYTKGLLLQNNGEPSTAREFYKRTVELNPGHRLAYYNLAYLEVESNNYPKALDYLEKLLRVDPEYVEGLHFRGAIYFENKRYDLAADDWSKALKLEPENTEIRDDLENLKKLISK